VRYLERGNEAAVGHPEITAWLNQVELVGYREPVRHFALPPAPSLRKGGVGKRDLKLIDRAGAGVFRV
jgi:hypothetical protein